MSVVGPGHVTGPKPGQWAPAINCPPTCYTLAHLETESYTLTATPDDGAVFTGWNNDCRGTQPTCTVSTPGQKSVYAAFAPVYALNVAKAGTGTGVVHGDGGIDCGETCTAQVRAGTQVTLVAVADSASVFAGWSGPCSGVGPCTLKVQSPGSVTATFDRDTSPPKVRALASAGVRGRPAELRYHASDNSGASRAQLSVLRRARLVVRIARPPGDVAPGRVYAALWRVPQKLKPGPLRFCVVAVDAAGNKSASSCARLTIA